MIDLSKFKVLKTKEVQQMSNENVWKLDDSICHTFYADTNYQLFVNEIACYVYQKETNLLYVLEFFAFMNLVHKVQREIEFPTSEYTQRILRQKQA